MCFKQMNVNMTKERIRRDQQGIHETFILLVYHSIHLKLRSRQVHTSGGTAYAVFVTGFLLTGDYIIFAYIAPPFDGCLWCIVEVKIFLHRLFL